MTLPTIIERSFALLATHTDASIVLLHPRSQYRSLLVAAILQQSRDLILHDTLSADDTSLPAFATSMTLRFSKQHPQFGEYLSGLSPADLHDSNRVLEALLRDLAVFDGQRCLMVLDEYDHTDSADDIQSFMARLVKRLPPSVQIIINSRTLPRLPWISFIAQRRAVILYDDQLIKDDFYQFQRQGEQTLEVNGLGSPKVQVDGEPVDGWEGHLPRLLFFFALDKPAVTRSEICKAFWPDLDQQQAVNIFHVTKRRLHKALKTNVLVHEKGFYRINPALNVQYDVIDFASRLIAARSGDASAVTSYQSALDVYRGPYLNGHHESWVVDHCEGYRAGLLEALVAMGEQRQAQGKLEQALYYFEWALREDFEREDIHRKVMLLFAKLGRRSEAAAHYYRLKDERAKQGRRAAAETEQLFNDIMSS